MKAEEPALTDATKKTNQLQLQLCAPNSYTAGKSRDCKFRLNTATEREETTASGREFQASMTRLQRKVTITNGQDARPI